MNDFGDLFALVKEKLRQELTETIFDVWLNEMQPVRLEDNLAVLALPEFKRRITEQKFIEPLHRAFRAALGFDVEIQLVDLDVSIAAQPVKKPDVVVQPQNDLPTGQEGNTFETFVVGGSNKFAHAAALAVADNPGKH
ncbi:MAG: hypothetical protein LBQ33_05280, partial [Oscillospiraceae bacterium]|nr:hypothetical protein [Oscillospiraceae bacterium]